MPPLRRPRSMRTQICAWTGTALPLPTRRGGFRRLRVHTTCCARAPGPSSSGYAGLSGEALKWADAAARASAALSSGRGDALSAGELLSFCAAKGVRVACNPWDAAALRALASRYVTEERAARTRSGPVWASLSENARAALAHAVCNGEGDVTYEDPKTGYTVFSYFGHLRRGNCCGVREAEDGSITRIHRCRHCPYTHAGALTNPKMIALRDRIPVVEYVRATAQRLVAEGLASRGMSDIGFGVSFLEGQNEINKLTGNSVSDEAKMSRSTVAVREHAMQGSIDDSKENFDCVECKDKQYTLCTRCKGWRILICPETMLCPQCDSKGFHPCLNCTPWRPPPITKFGG